MTPAPDQTLSSQPLGKDMGLTFQQTRLQTKDPILRRIVRWGEGGQRQWMLAIARMRKCAAAPVPEIPDVADCHCFSQSNW